MAHLAWQTYDRLLRTSWFHRAIVVVFIIQAVLGLALALGIDWTSETVGRYVRDGAVLTALVSFAMILVGIARLRAKGARLDAYRWFERALLVSVLITQVIIFWYDQLGGLNGLVMDLALLAVLRYLIRQEEVRD
jgi:hypothetical protein